MLQPNQLKQYISLSNSPGFFGYGKWESEIYILGIEEAGCYSEELIQQKINKYFELEFGDDGLFDNRSFQYDLIDLNDPKLRNYADFYNGYMHKLGYVQKVATLLKVLENSERETYNYVQNLLGSVDSNHSLIEILPLPCPKVNDWFYPNWVDCQLLPFMRSKRLYKNEIIKIRSSFIKTIIETSEEKKLILFLADGRDKVNYWNQISPVQIYDYNVINGIRYHISATRKMYVVLPFPGSRASNGIFNSEVEIINIATEIQQMFDNL